MCVCLIEKGRFLTHELCFRPRCPSPPPNLPDHQPLLTMIHPVSVCLLDANSCLTFELHRPLHPPPNLPEKKYKSYSLFIASRDALSASLISCILSMRANYEYVFIVSRESISANYDKYS